MDDCPLLCPTCPMVPKGVTAALTDAEIVTMTSLRRFRFAVQAPQLAQPFVGNTRIHTEVVASAHPTIEVGDTASMLVGANGMAYQALKEVVRNCNGPVFSWFQKILKPFGFRGRCGVMDNRHMTHLDDEEY